MTFKELQDFIKNKMRMISGIIPLLSVMLLGILDSQGSSVYAQEVNSVSQLTTKDIEQWMQDILNWGRWGENDELGTLNLITPEKRRQAAALVTDGITVSLAHDFSKEISSNNPRPHQQSFNIGEQFASDSFQIGYHGWFYSHIDALCHMFHDEKMYNGFAKTLISSEGSQRLGIQNMRNGIFTRGILVDIPLLKGVPYLEPGIAIMPEDLDAWEQRTGVQVQPSDVLLVRTGRWGREQQLGSWNVREERAGLHASTVKWLRVRDVAALGCDVFLNQDSD